MPANDKNPSSSPQAVSKIELDRLVQERNKDRPAPALNPPGLGAAASPQQMPAAEREKRIAHITQRLDAQRGRAQEGFQKSAAAQGPVGTPQIGALQDEIKSREARIKGIRDRLSSQKGRATDDFNKSR